MSSADAVLEPVPISAGVREERARKGGLDAKAETDRRPAGATQEQRKHREKMEVAFHNTAAGGEMRSLSARC
jgi:hypothetical protein